MAFEITELEPDESAPFTLFTLEAPPLRSQGGDGRATPTANESAEACPFDLNRGRDPSGPGTGPGCGGDFPTAYPNRSYPTPTAYPNGTFPEAPLGECGVETAGNSIGLALNISRRTDIQSVGYEFRGPNGNGIDETVELPTPAPTYRAHLASAVHDINVSDPDIRDDIWLNYSINYVNGTTETVNTTGMGGVMGPQDICDIATDDPDDPPPLEGGFLGGGG